MEGLDAADSWEKRRRQRGREKKNASERQTWKAGKCNDGETAKERQWGLK